VWRYFVCVLSSEKMNSEAVSGSGMAGGPSNFDEDDLLAEGIEVVDEIRELAPLSEVLRAVDHAYMDLDMEDTTVEAAVEEAVEDLQKLSTSALGGERSPGSRPMRRSEGVVGGRVSKGRGSRGGQKKPRNPRQKSVHKVQQTLRSIARAVDRPNVIVAPRPKPKHGPNARRAECAIVAAEKEVHGEEPKSVVENSGVPLEAELVTESTLLTPEMRIQVLKRERNLIKEGPLKSSEVPDSMRLGAICGPASRGRLPHERVVDMPEAARRYEEHKFTTGKLGLEPPLRRRTRAYTTLKKAKYDARQGVEVTDPLSLRELASIYGDRSPPNTDWTLLHSGREERYFVLNGFISWLTALEHFVLASGMGVSLVPKCELAKSGKLPPDLIYNGWVLPGIGVADVGGPISMKLRLGSVVKPVDFYVTESVTTAVLGRDVVISHGLCFFSETGNFLTANGDPLNVKVVPRSKEKRPVM